MSNIPPDQPSFGHLQVLTGPRGLYEHALYSRPRTDHGYSLDDNGRALVVLTRALHAGDPTPEDLGRRCLHFVLRAGTREEWSDRQTNDGVWRHGATDDAVGRALWGLGVLAAGWPDSAARDGARKLLGRSGLRSAFWRPHAYALLGLTKAHVAGLDEVDGPTIERMAARLPRGKWDRPEWPWPEPALTYDNARLPEALMAAGEALEDPSMETDGLRLLEWLVGVETGAYGFSFTPVGGRRLGDPQPAFDQQPLEAWGMADATMRAHALTGDGRWSDLAELALAWFFGANDTGDSLYDPVSGAGFDGLTADGPNLNRGAESTLAALGTILGVRRSLPEAVAATPL